jgi:hypothetical protein
MIEKSNIFFFDGMSIAKHAETNQKTYHYTSPMGLCSIIQKKKLWFTDCQFLNDKSEYVYIKRVLIKALTALHNENPEDFADYLLSTPYTSIEMNGRKGNESFSKGFKISRYYLFCTSLKSDSHNMWSYFMKNGNYLGYNFRFDIDNFVNLFTSLADLTLTHGKVIYNEEEQVKQIKDKLEFLDTRYEEKIKKLKGHKFSDNRGNEYNPEDILIDEYQNDLFEFLQERCLFFKHHAFESEDEYRFVVKVANAYTGENFKLNHRVGNNGIIIPYREFSIEPMQIMNQIMLSPIMEKEIAKAGLISLLGLSYERQFNIEFSEIDVRF